MTQREKILQAPPSSKKVLFHRGPWSDREVFGPSCEKLGGLDMTVVKKSSALKKKKSIKTKSH